MERMDQNMPFLLKYENVAWYENGRVRILDRRVFPTEVRFVECADYREVVQAIADMVTQSAGPYTAVGMGMALAAWQVRGESKEKQTAFLKQAAYDLRPPMIWRTRAPPPPTATGRSPSAPPIWPRPRSRPGRTPSPPSWTRPWNRSTAATARCRSSATAWRSSSRRAAAS